MVKKKDLSRRIERVEKLLDGMEKMLSFTAKQVESLQDVTQMIREELEEIKSDDSLRDE